MPDILFKWIILFIIGVLFTREKNQPLCCKPNLLIFNLCVLGAKIGSTKSQPLNMVLPQSNQRFYVKLKNPYLPPKNVITKSETREISLAAHLAEIKNQESILRVKKSLSKQERQPHSSELKKKLRQLMNNVTDTLTDMDWFFGLDQINSPGPARIKGKAIKKSNKLNETRKIYNKKEDKETNDALIDSFIKQIYEVNPSIFEKLRSRIDRQVSFKRHVRLADDQAYNGSSSNRHSNNPMRRLEVVKRVFVKKLVPFYNNEEQYDADYNDESAMSTLEGVLRSNEVAKGTKYGAKQMKATTTTRPTSTVEYFYDYGDYYKESDYGGNDISDLDINKVDFEYSTQVIEENAATDSSNIKRNVGSKKKEYSKTDR